MSNPLERLAAFCREVGGAPELGGEKLVCRFGARRRVRVAAGWLLGGYRGFAIEVDGRVWGFVRSREAWRFAVRERGGAARVDLRSALLVEREAEGFEASVSEDPDGRRVLSLELL
jgi:hypothetical protein